MKDNIRVSKDEMRALFPHHEVESSLSAVTSAQRLLIVEDDPDIARLLEYMLQDAGYQTSVAGSAAQAKTLLATQAFDGMTLDIGLPGQNGMTFLNELREQPETQNLPVVIVSAFPDKVKNDLSRDTADTTAWIQKPIDLQMLISRLAQALR